MEYSSVIVQTISDHVQQEMKELCAAHDFFHIQRVIQTAQKIQKYEGGDKEIIELGALLHESLDKKLFGDETMIQRRDSLHELLYSLDFPVDKINQVLFIVENVGYSKSLERTSDFIGSTEFKIVEDADRLDAIGAIAIARTFTYGGSKNRSIYDPEIQPELLINKNTNSNKKNSTTINHFYEKLLLLKDLMHSQTAKKIAEQRHTFMQGYLEQFYKERNGDLDK